jgi:hypothetical protein
MFFARGLIVAVGTPVAWRRLEKQAVGKLMDHMRRNVGRESFLTHLILPEDCV